MLPPHCDPQGAFLIAISSAFGICIPSTISLVSTVFGTLSMMSWLCAQIPQVHKNYLSQSVEGLSWAFLAIWLAGDICKHSLYVWLKVDLKGGWRNWPLIFWKQAILRVQYSSSSSFFRLL